MSSDNFPAFFIKAISIKKNDFLNFLHIGWDKCPSKYSYSHYRNMYIIHIVKSGTGIIETNNHKYTVHKDDAFLVRPDSLTVQTADEFEPFELYFFAFNGKFAKELIEKTVFKSNNILGSITDSSIYETIIEIALNIKNNSYSEIYPLERLFKLLSYFDISNHSLTVRQDENNTYQKYITFVREYIQFNYSKAIKISDIAKQLNINRSHLYRIFKNNTGSSIEEYLVSVRINNARSLLDDTDLPVTTISELVGYSYYPTFLRMFKSHTGLTPKQYRENEID